MSATATILASSCTCNGPISPDCVAHKLAQEHRDATQHMVIIPTASGIPWPGGLRKAPYCLDCDWPEEGWDEERLCGICGKTYEKCDCAETGRR
jgi:hypothetical protein